MPPLGKPIFLPRYSSKHVGRSKANTAVRTEGSTNSSLINASIEVVCREGINFCEWFGQTRSVDGCGGRDGVDDTLVGGISVSGIEAPLMMYLAFSGLLRIFYDEHYIGGFEVWWMTPLSPDLTRWCWNVFRTPPCKIHHDKFTHVCYFN